MVDEARTDLSPVTSLRAEDGNVAGVSPRRFPTSQARRRASPGPRPMLCRSASGSFQTRPAATLRVRQRKMRLWLVNWSAPRAIGKSVSDWMLVSSTDGSATDDFPYRPPEPRAHDPHHHATIVSSPTDPMYS